MAGVLKSMTPVSSQIKGIREFKNGDVPTLSVVTIQRTRHNSLPVKVKAILK